MYSKSFVIAMQAAFFNGPSHLMKLILALFAYERRPTAGGYDIVHCGFPQSDVQTRLR